MYMVTREDILAGKSNAWIDAYRKGLDFAYTSVLAYKKKEQILKSIADEKKRAILAKR